jgi:pimeloyl-ACP methyl ester carboxylesterase
MSSLRVSTRWISLSLAVVLASCGGASTNGVPVPTTASEVPAFNVQPVEWGECDDGSEVTLISCGTLEVPFDYEQPDKGSFVLYIKKREASGESIGPLLVNPGGPGFGGSSLANDAMYYFSKTLLDSFDIIAWDPRGTGLTTPSVDCVDDYDQYFGLDSPPDDENERQALIDAAQRFNDACAERSGTILPYISTVASARDMDSIRQALGVEKISYFGFSYGSELGATWATLFPDTVRAAVLDGAADPNATSIDQGLAQAKGFEQQLSTFLAKCSADESCPFHNNGNAEGAFDRLMLDIDAKPLVVSANRTPVTQGVAYTAVAQAMYSDYYWPDLEKALSDAQQGDGVGLLQLYDDYFQRQDDGTYGNELEAFLAISCLDGADRPTVEEVDATVDVFVKAAPRLGANFAYGYGCSLWPVEPVTPFSVNGAGAGPIVVIGTTGDAATPLESTRKMVAALEDGRLIVVEANQHTGYGANECVTTAVDQYLVRLTAPDQSITCGDE